MTSLKRVNVSAYNNYKSKFRKKKNDESIIKFKDNYINLYPLTIISSFIYKSTAKLYIVSIFKMKFVQ